MDICGFWKAVLEQNGDAIRGYFDKNAYVNWHCTNEHFTVEEFIIANCEYPGSWAGNVERIEQTDDLLITVTYVYSQDGTLSFHATSFIQVLDGKITAIDEYWADDGVAPKWRLDKQIGTVIK